MAGQQSNYQQKVFAMLAIAISFGFIWKLAAYGRSEFYSTAAGKENSISMADRAIEIYPRSPDAYVQRGLINRRNGEPVKAEADFVQSLKFRPGDYFVWLQIGHCRKENNDDAGAIAAFRESVRLAPFYGQPRWQLGILLIENNKSEEGWENLKQTFTGDPGYLPAAIDLAWVKTIGNAAKMEELLQLEEPSQRMILGLYLFEKGATLDAASYLCNSGVLTPASRQTLIERLFARQEFRLAYRVETGDCRFDSSKDGLSLIDHDAGLKNKSFEDDIALDRNGFDWELERNPKNFSYSRDKRVYFEGSNSLKIKFDGNITGKILRQLAIVEPDRLYRLKFAVQARDMITVSYPLLSVRDAADPNRVLARSEAFTGGADGWLEQQIEFKTSDQTEAVWISLERQECQNQVCPIFGSIWIDDLDLHPAK